MDTDAELVARCRAGSRDALADLVERFRPEVFAICFKLLRHRQDAEDTAQESLVRVVRGLGTFDAARPLKPWVMQVTVNRCRTALAVRSRHQTASDPGRLDGVEARPDPSVEPEFAAALAQALAGLRPDHREAFVLFHDGNLGYDEIAASLGRPVGTVKTWIYRARAQLFDALYRQGMIPAELTTQEPG